MATSYAKVRTTRASEYLIGLSRVWNQKLPESGQAPTHVEIPFANGQIAINASAEYLEIRLNAGSIRDATRLEDLVSDHLDRLSCGEDIPYHWINPDVEQASRRVFSKI